MLSEQQSQELKKRILQQLEGQFPSDKFHEISQYIESLSPQDFEEFLVRNKLIQQSEIQDQIETQIASTIPSEQIEQKNIFRLIIEGKIKSYKITENKEALAVLEINPQALGHVIIIPKKEIKHASDLNTQAFSLAKRVAKKIKQVLKLEEVKINSASIMNHAIINIIPVYENGNGLNNEKITPEKLSYLQSKLEIMQKEKISKNPKIKPLSKKLIKEIKYKLPRRIP